MNVVHEEVEDFSVAQNFRNSLKAKTTPPNLIHRVDFDVWVRFQVFHSLRRGYISEQQMIVVPNAKGSLR